MEKVEPYWHKNNKWYYWDLKEQMFKLTKYATKKAIASYNKYYKDLQHNN